MSSTLLDHTPRNWYRDFTTFQLSTFIDERQLTGDDRVAREGSGHQIPSSPLWNLSRLDHREAKQVAHGTNNNFPVADLNCHPL